MTQAPKRGFKKLHKLRKIAEEKGSNSQIHHMLKVVLKAEEIECMINAKENMSISPTTIFELGIKKVSSLKRHIEGLIMLNDYVDAYVRFGDGLRTTVNHRELNDTKKCRIYHIEMFSDTKTIMFYKLEDDPDDITFRSRIFKLKAYRRQILDQFSINDNMIKIGNKL